jgi:beta-lactamase class A
MKKLSFLLVLVTLAVSAHADDLTAKLQALISAHQGKVGLYAKNLKTGQTVVINADEPVQTASVIKLPLMLQAYEQVKAGKLKLTDPIVLTKDNQVPGSGVLYALDPGLKLTLKDAITLMMIVSDNTGTNLTIDAVGLKPTNEMIARMGLKNTYFYKKVYKPADGPMPPDQKKFGLGKTTAREMATVMESIYNCDMGDRELCKQMIWTMRNQQYRDMLPRYLEQADASEDLSAIADKIGALDAVRNDVALVYTKNGPVVISIFTYDNADTSWTPENKAEMLIGHLARTIVDAWSPQGLMPKVVDTIAPEKIEQRSSEKPTRIRVSEGVLDGIVVKKVLPTLPCSKDGAHDKGLVTTAVLVDYDGTVKTASPMSGEPELANCAIVAIKQWQFKPYFINNAPVQVESRVVLKFSKKRVEAVVGDR